MVRVSIYDHAGTLQILDASGDLAGGVVSYEQTPDGCGSAELRLGKRYEEIYAEGYWTARNIVEISTADDVLQTSCLAGATKLYVGSKLAYDTAQGHPTGQIWLWDGTTSCGRIPVTGVGTDAGGDYITVGTPLSGGGNPTTLPAFGSGTYIFRRRYAGLIMQTQRPNSPAPGAVVRCAGLSTRIAEAVCSFTLTTGTVDVGTAIYDLLSQFSSRWPELTISAGNFPTTGQTSFDNSYDRTQVSRVVADLLAAANSNGDQWHLVTGHDRTPRLVKLYTSSGNTYTYNVTLPQGTGYFEPRNVQNTDQDASQLYNSVEVIGDTNPATQQPYRAIVQDSTSISTYGQIDAQPVTNTACKSDAQCAQHGQALLNQQSLARSNAAFTVSTRNDVAVSSPPMGLSRGDVVLGVHNVTLSHFSSVGSSANNCPDSEIVDHTAWNNTGLSFGSGLGPGGSNVWAAGTSASSPYADSPPIYVAPGRTFVLSAYLAATYVTAGSIEAYAYTEAGVISGSTITQSNGGAGRVASSQFTVPANSTTLRVRFIANAITTSGGTALFAQPMLSDGGADRAYVANYGAPDVYGLVSSAVTTIEVAGDSVQQVRFSEIEPDWNADVRERANALATALQQNTLSGASVTQYCVSADAFGYSASGLVVTPPAFWALFAQGTQPITASGTFAINASTTNWVWLASNGSWNVQTTPATQTGDILYGIFTTNATGIIGFTAKAPIGALKIGLPYLLNGVAFTPAVTASITNEVPGGLTSQVKIVATCTNQPTDGSFSKARFWYRQSGQATWLLLADFAPQNGSGSPTAPNAPTATGQYTIRYPDAMNGLTYEFGCSLEAGSSAETAVVSLGTITPTATNAGPGGISIPGASNVNLIPDPIFQFQTGSNLAYWKQGGSGIAIEAPSKSPPYKYLAAIGSGITAAMYSAPIQVVNGQSYCLTVETGHSITAGTAHFGIVSTADANYAGSSAATPATVYSGKDFTGDAGTNTLDSISWTATFTGQIAVCFWVVGLNGEADFQIPQLEIGTAYSGFKISAAPVSPNNGVAQTALDPGVQTSLGQAQAPADGGTPQWMNASFEAAAVSGSGDIAAGWYVQNNTLSSAISAGVSTYAPNAYFGSNYLVFGATGSGSIPANTTGQVFVFQRQSVVVAPGQTWRLRCFMFTPNGAAPAGLTWYARVVARITYSDASYTDLLGTAMSATTGAYTEFATNVTIPTPAGKTISSCVPYVVFSVTNSTGAAVALGSFAATVDCIGFWKQSTAGDLAGGSPTDLGDIFDGNSGGDGTRIHYPRHAVPITSSIGSSADSAGSYIASGVVNARAISGGNASDTGALLDGAATSRLLLPRHATPVTSTVSSSADAAGSYVASGVVNARAISGGSASDTGPLLDGGATSRLLLGRHQADIANLQYRNYIQNGRLLSGVGAGGWKALSGFTGSYAGTYTVNGTSWTTCEQISSITTGTGYYQAIPVKPGTTYSFAALLYNQTSGQTCRLTICDPGFATVYNGSPGSIQGTTPAFYGAASVVNNGSIFTTGVNRWELCCGTFTVPSGVTQIVIIPCDAYTATGTSFWFAPMLWEGSKWQDYIDGMPFDSTGAFTASSAFNVQGSVLPTPTDFQIGYSTSSTSTALSFWIYGAGGSGNPVHFYLPDGSTVTAPWSQATCGSSGTPLVYDPGVNATIYGLIYYNPNTQTWTKSFQTTAFTAAQVQAGYRDGYVALIASYDTQTNSSQIASTGTLSTGSKGGGNRYA